MFETAHVTRRENTHEKSRYFLYSAGARKGCC
jgi:hypothetical protein